MQKFSVSPAGTDLVKSWEGIEDGDPTTVNLDPYLDPVDIWTIGWGHALRDGRDFLRGKANRAKAFALFPGGITMQQAEDLLAADLLPVEIYLNALPTIEFNQARFDACASFCFNLGIGAFDGSTLRKRLVERRYQEAADEFKRWNKGKDPKTQALVELAGLTARRAAERALFLKGGV